MTSSRRLWGRPEAECSHFRWHLSWCTAGLALVVYGLTAAPGLVWGDGIELAAVCASLGIAHPTGYPLFTVLGHLFSYLPVGEVPFRVTLFCAVCMAASVACMEQLLARLLHVAVFRGAVEIPWWWRGASIAGALAFAFCLGPWTHATRTEVYGLQLLIQSLALLVAWRVLASRGLTSESELEAGHGWFFVLTGLVGLGLAHHLLTIILGPLWLAVLWRHLRPVSGPRLRRRLLGHGAALLLGLLPILYLPLRAQQNPAVSWGHPATFEGLMWTLSGGDFPDELFFVETQGRSFTGTSFVSHMVRRGVALGNYLIGMVMPSAGLPLAFRWLMAGIAGYFLARGVAILWRWVPTFAWPLGVGLALYLGVLFTYNIGDITDYQLGFFALLWPLLWTGVWDLVASSPGGFSGRPRGSVVESRRKLWGALTWGLPNKAAAAATVLTLLLLPLALGGGNFDVADRSEERLVDRFAERLLADLPPQAILLTQGDFSTATAWYRQAVLGERPDVLVFCLDFFYDPWYGQWMARRDLAGRQVETSDSGGEWGESFLDALDRLIVAPNPETPILIMPSPRQARALAARFELRPVTTLLDADEVAAYDQRGWRAPQPRVFSIRSRSPSAQSSQSP